MVNRLKKGFTIIEVMIVIAVLSILITIVTSAASSAIKQSRGKRAESMRYALEAGFATYYAQRGDWPDGIKDYADRGDGEHDLILLAFDEANRAFQELVNRSMLNKANPYLDVGGLFVTQAGLARKANANGCDFKTAVMPVAKGGRGWGVSQMAFGYQDRENAKFRRFYIAYNCKTDTVKVFTHSQASSHFSGTSYQGRLNTESEGGAK